MNLTHMYQQCVNFDSLGRVVTLTHLDRFVNLTHLDWFFKFTILYVPIHLFHSLVVCQCHSFGPVCHFDSIGPV